MKHLGQPQVEHARLYLAYPMHCPRCRLILKRLEFLGGNESST